MQGAAEQNAAPPTLDAHSIDYGSVLIFTYMPMGASLLLLAALVAALTHGLLARFRVGTRYIVAARVGPPALLVAAALWIWIHQVWRVPVANYDGFKPLGEPLVLVFGALLYGAGDLLLFTASKPCRALIGAAVGGVGLVALAIGGWRVHLFEAQPLTDILVVLGISLAAAGMMVWLWRRLGGKDFGWIFAASLITAVFVLGGMTSHSFIRLPGAMLACGIASLAAMLLSIARRAGSKGMTGWGPWFGTIFFQTTISMTALGAPTY